MDGINVKTHSRSALVEHLINMAEEQFYKSSKKYRRGGVEGAIETDYQRNRIQQESIEYEH